MTRPTEPAAPRVLALVPGYEEGPRIGSVVEAARRHLEVLVVDDGSTDDTAAAAEAAGARVLRQVPNQGKGAALRAGFRLALDEGWDAVLTLDADGQHDPDEIPRFVAAFGAPGRLRPAAGADHRPPRLRADAAGPPPVEHGRHRGVLVGRRPARARQPVGLPAARPAADGRDARQPTSRASSSRSR